MKTSPVTPGDLENSVVSVPPLAWTTDQRIADKPNRAIVRRLDAGGVKTYLYGGNANVQNLPTSDFGALLDAMKEWAPANAWMLPSIGPDFGKGLDQARVAHGRGFPALMTLPAGNAVTHAGLATGMRRLSDAAGVPLVGYVRSANYMPSANMKELVADGVLCAVKYAVEDHDPSDDPYLAAICDAIGPDLVVSGMGERPALTHMRHYHIAGFTSGAICLAPELSMRMLVLAKSGDFMSAEAVREVFVPLEDLRERIGPVPVLHAVMELSGIAQMGPLQPFQAPVDASHLAEIKAVGDKLVRSGANAN